MSRVVFACVHNAGRSQMAAACFNRVSDPAKATAVSAGTQPAEYVHREVVEAMREEGLYLYAVAPQKLTVELATGAAFLVTMGCGEDCPYLPGVPILDWRFQTPRVKASKQLGLSATTSPCVSARSLRKTTGCRRSVLSSQRQTRLWRPSVESAPRPRRLEEPGHQRSKEHGAC